MFGLTAQQNYFVYHSACDMRKGFNGLSGLVRNELEKDPLSGDVFIFINRRRNKMKLLVWDRSGFLLYYKSLERGTFELPIFQEGELDKAITWSDLVLILEGVVLSSIEKRKRFSLANKLAQTG